MSSTPRPRAHQLGPWLVLAGAVVLALVLHGPLVAALGSSIPGEPGSDALRGLWSLWLIGQEGWLWPLGSDRMAFPDGARMLPFPAVSLTLAAPTAKLLGPQVAFTGLVLFHSVFAVVGTAWLVRSLGGGWGMGFCAGALVATQPLLGGALRDGTLEVLAVGWMPVMLGAFVRACKGSWRWGVAAGVLYVIIVLESAYYASFTAVLVLGALASLRSKAGVKAAAVSGGVVALGVALFAAVFWAILVAAPERAGGDDDALRAANAIDPELFWQLAVDPGSRGWRVGDLWAPPWVHVVALCIAALFSMRRHPWLAVAAVFLAGLSVHHESLSWWTGGPIGGVVRFPRRYVVAVVLAAGAGLFGVSQLLKRWPWIELASGLALGGWLSFWGYSAGGWRSAYPLLELPELAFVDHLAADGEDCAVLFAPLTVPSEGGRRDELPVFADVHPDLSSADVLTLAVLADKRGFTAPDLITLQKRGSAGQLATTLSDLALPTYGQAVPGHAEGPPVAYKAELAYLMGQGLKYVVIDEAKYAPRELEILLGILEPVAVEQTHFDDGTGVLVVRLYDERPERAERVDVGAQPGLTYRGRVVGGSHLHTNVHLLVTHETGEQVCQITPEDGSFDCGTVGVVDQVELFAAGRSVPVRTSGDYYDVTVEVLEPPP